MPDYKNRGFKKDFSRRPGGDAPRQLYKADCSNCHKVCEVPFRPNGMKPVFCRDCFKPEDDRDARGGRDSRPAYGRKEFGARPSYNDRPAPSNDQRIDEVKRQLIMMESKLDRLVKLVENMDAPKAAAAPVKKVVAKKVAKKKA